MMIGNLALAANDYCICIKMAAAVYFTSLLNTVCSLQYQKSGLAPYSPKWPTSLIFDSNEDGTKIQHSTYDRYNHRIYYMLPLNCLCPKRFLIWSSISLQ